MIASGKTKKVKKTLKNKAFVHFMPKVPLKQKGIRKMFRKRIFTRRLAIYLYEHGCTILGTEPNPKNPDLLVWVFEDGTKLQNGITEYIEARRND